MNTDTDYIEIDQGEEAPLEAAPFEAPVGEATAAPAKGFAKRHGVIAAVVVAVVVAGFALTSCFAVKSRHPVEVEAPKKDIQFEVAQKRPWLHDNKGEAVKHSPAPALGTGGGTGAARNALLTFDDGPNPTNTPLILDWLKQHGLHATFFVVGENAVRYPALLQRIVAEGHTIGNHSWSHPKLLSMSDTAVRSQLRRTHDAIVKGCGVAPKAFRPPYGAISKRQRSWIEKEFGYTTVLWDIDTEDWKGRNTSSIAATIDRGLRTPGQHVILAHDIHPRILPALRSLETRWFPTSTLARLDTDGLQPLKAR